MGRPRKTGLGKGLDALFVDNYVEEKEITHLKISEIEPHLQQPREHFDEKLLSELADSIRSHGVLQPLVVRPLDSGGYQIVAGERRWRASRMAGLREVPVIIRDLSDMETLEIAIIENLQREDLSSVELATGYQQLMDEHGLTQAEVAEKVGKSRPAVANTVRLLNLPEPVLELLRQGKITPGHARGLLALEEEEMMLEVAKRVAKEGLLVRDIEKLAARLRKEKEEPVDSGGKPRSRHPNEGWGHSYYKELELALASELGRKVSIVEGEGKTTLSLEFYSKEELDDFVSRMTANK